ncbi:MAG: glycosyltransferase family 39 protein [bacterium]|nr:glycosyltransferase family 39 protein [bacterium]
MRIKDFWFLLTTSFIFFILRLPSLFEPYWYGDEGIYQVLGMAMRQGRLLYRDIWDNKPPLLYIIYSFFSSDQFMIRLASLFVGILSIVVFFFLAKKLFKNPLSRYFSTTFFAVLFGLPIIEGNIANAENFMILPVTLAGLLIFDLVQKLKNSDKIAISKIKIFFVSGFLLGMAFLIKVVAVFDLAAFMTFLIISTFPAGKTIIEEKKYFFKFFKESLFMIIGFSIPIAITIIFFLLNGALVDFLKAALIQNVGYVGYGNKLLIPQGLLIAKLLLLSIAVLILFIKRGFIKFSIIFISLWFFFSIFNALFSQRPYTHYLLVILPSFSLLLGLFFEDKKFRKIILGIAILMLIFLPKNFSFYTKSLSYYQNFTEFILSKKNTTDYQAFFDKQTPIDYKLAEFINSHAGKKDEVFIWGNNAQVYKMIHKLPPGRYTVAYHMTTNQNSLEETTLAIEKVSPKLIILMPKQPIIPSSLLNYTLRFNLENVSIYERVF